MGKLKSRKFWIVVVGSIVDLVAAFGFQIISPEQGAIIATSLLGLYVLVEGVIDAKNKGSVDPRK